MQDTAFYLTGDLFSLGEYFIVSYCTFKRHICPTFYVMCVLAFFCEGLCFSFVVMQISSVHIRKSNCLFLSLCVEALDAAIISAVFSFHLI